MQKSLQQVLQLSVEERQDYIEQHGAMLFETMLASIGVPEDELRDKVNYRLFIELLSAQMIPTDIMQHLVEVLPTQRFLYKGIAEGESDDVFTRSFAALWLTGLFYVDQQTSFLTAEQAQLAMEQSLSYLNKERDVRGFVDIKGWVHSMAHGADLAAAILSHPHAKVQYGAVILQGVKESFWKGRVYTDDEDERLVKIFEVFAKNNFPEDVLVEWMEQVFDKLQRHLYEVGYTPELFVARTNTMQFAKTLYFTLKFSGKYDKLRGITSIFISKWMKMQ